MSHERVLSREQIEWAYDRWCEGYTQIQIAEALFVCERTISRVLKGRKKIRHILKYEVKKYD